MLLFGDLRDGIFGGVMIINAVIGIVSELRAKRTLDSLAIVDAPQATVLRDGTLSVVPARDVVLDDVIDLTLGAQVSVDGTVLSSAGLEIDESLLTGESRPVKKKQGDQLLAGTSVVAGAGRMVATAVGERVYAQGLSEQARAFTRTVSEIQTSINRVLQVAAVCSFRNSPPSRSSRAWTACASTRRGRSPPAAFVCAALRSSLVTRPRCFAPWRAQQAIAPTRRRRPFGSTSARPRDRVRV